MKKSKSTILDMLGNDCNRSVVVDSIESFHKLSKFFDDLGVFNTLKLLDEETVKTILNIKDHLLIAEFDTYYVVNKDLITSDDIISLDELMSDFYEESGTGTKKSDGNTNPIDLSELLKDTPKGTKFWSPIFGEVTLDRIDYGNSGDIFVILKDGNWRAFDRYGRFRSGIWPSENCYDWKQYSIPENSEKLKRYLRYTETEEEFWLESSGKNVKFLGMTEKDEISVRLDKVFFTITINNETINNFLPKNKAMSWEEYFDNKMVDRNVMVRTSLGATWKLKIYRGNRQYMGLDGMNSLWGRPEVMIIPYEDFDPKNIEESLKYNLNGKRD